MPDAGPPWQSPDMSRTGSNSIPSKDKIGSLREKASTTFNISDGVFAASRHSFSHFGSELLKPLLQSANRRRDNFSNAGFFSASSFAVANAFNIFMVFLVISLPLMNPCCALLSWVWHTSSKSNANIRSKTFRISFGSSISLSLSSVFALSTFGARIHVLCVMCASVFFFPAVNSSQASRKIGARMLHCCLIAMEGTPSGPGLIPVGVPFMIRSTSSRSGRVLHAEKFAVHLSRNSFPASGFALSVPCRSIAAAWANSPCRFLSRV